MWEDYLTKLSEFIEAEQLGYYIIIYILAVKIYK